MDAEIRGIESKLEKTPEKLQNNAKSDIIKEDSVSGPSLVDSRTGGNVATEYKKFSKAELSGLKKKGWKFDWVKPINDGCDVYGLTLKGDTSPQALVAFKTHPKKEYLYVDILETAPKNYGSAGIYKSTAPRLMAMVASESFKRGCDGYIQLVAKTKLISHYIKSLGAIQIGSGQTMYIDTRAALELIKKYTGG